MAIKKTPSRDEFAAELKKVKAETEKEITKKTEEVLRKSPPDPAYNNVPDH